MNKLKILGELLSCDTSLLIIQTLSHKEMYSRQIETEMGIRASLVRHHIAKLEKVGIIQYTTKRGLIVKRDSKYYSINNTFLPRLEQLLEEIKN